MNKKVSIAVVFVVGIILISIAATVPFSAFSPSWFSTNGNQISILPTSVLQPSSNLSDVSSLRASGSNIAILQMSTPGSGNGINDMLAARPKYPNQLGLSFYSVNEWPYIWAARGTNQGTNSYGAPIWILGGIAGIGDKDRSYSAGDGFTEFSWIMLGGPSHTRKSYVFTNGVLGDTLWFLKSYNPFSDVGFAIPFYGTNAVGSPVLTNDDGVVIYQQDQFGFQFLVVPDGFPGGETNQAGSQVIIANSYDSYWSYNDGIGGLFAQLPVMAFDFSRHKTNNAFPVTAGFPHWVAHNPVVTTVTNPLFDWTLRADEINNILYSATNGTTYSSNFQSLGAPIFRWARQSGADASVANFNVNSNAFFGDTSGIGLIWDNNGGSYRSGLVIPNGHYPSLGYATGGLLEILQASGGSLFSPGSWTQVARFENGGVFTENVGIGSKSTTSAIAITATGITNSSSVNMKAFVSGTGVLITNFDNAGNPYLTNTITVTLQMIDIIQPGGSIRAASGLSGRLVPF